MSVFFLRMMYPVSYLGNIAYIITKKKSSLEQPKKAWNPAKILNYD